MWLQHAVCEVDERQKDFSLGDAQRSLLAYINEKEMGRRKESLA